MPFASVCRAAVRSCVRGLAAPIRALSAAHRRVGDRINHGPQAAHDPMRLAWTHTLGTFGVLIALLAVTNHVHDVTNAVASVAAHLVAVVGFVVVAAGMGDGLLRRAMAQELRAGRARRNGPMDDQIRPARWVRTLYNTQGALRIAGLVVKALEPICLVLLSLVWLVAFVGFVCAVVQGTHPVNGNAVRDIATGLVFLGLTAHHVLAWKTGWWDSVQPQRLPRQIAALARAVPNATTAENDSGAPPEEAASIPPEIASVRPAALKPGVVLPLPVSDSPDWIWLQQKGWARLQRHTTATDAEVVRRVANVVDAVAQDVTWLHRRIAHRDQSSTPPCGSNQIEADTVLVGGLRATITALPDNRANDNPIGLGAPGSGCGLSRWIMHPDRTTIPAALAAAKKMHPERAVLWDALKALHDCPQAACWFWLSPEAMLEFVATRMFPGPALWDAALAAARPTDRSAVSAPTRWDQVSLLCADPAPTTTDVLVGSDSSPVNRLEERPGPRSARTAPAPPFSC